MIMLHVNIKMLHVDINKLHVDIILLTYIVIYCILHVGDRAMPPQ